MINWRQIVEPTFEQELEDWATEWNVIGNFIVSLHEYHDLGNKYPDKDIKQELINLGLWNSSMREFTN